MGDVVLLCRLIVFCCLWKWKEFLLLLLLEAFFGWNFLRIFESSGWICVYLCACGMVCSPAAEPPQHPSGLEQSAFPQPAFPCTWLVQQQFNADQLLLVSTGVSLLPVSTADPWPGFPVEAYFWALHSSWGIFGMKSPAVGTFPLQPGLLSFPGAADMKNCFCV